MWKLRIATGDGEEWLSTTNNHVGRQYWEFDPDAGTDEERAEIERVRDNFKTNRFEFKQSADLLMRLQLRKENQIKGIPKAIKLKETEELTNEAVTTTNEDGGWGLHIEGHSTMFGSVVSYITLRLLGEEADSDAEDMAVVRGRKWILDHGGAVGIPSWGKFWLTILGVHEWGGCNPMPPEFWLLPKFSPVHPGKMLCYCRLVYMPMSYLYGKRYVGRITGLVQALRQELYTDPYHEINWNKARNTCAKEDLYYPHPFVQDMAWGILHNVVEPILTRWPFSKLREKAMKVAMEHVLCLIATWVEDPNGDAYKRHLARIPDYFWVAEDGMKMQVRDNPPGDFSKMYRHTSKGAWTFSMQDHGWQVSDCTAEGLKVALLYSQMSPELVGEKFETERLCDSVNVILSLQSENGGFPAWEPQRAYSWLEVQYDLTSRNTREISAYRISDPLIMKNYSCCFRYVECTSSAIQGLTLFKKLHPGHRTKEIEHCISRAVKYIEDTQNLDGSCPTLQKACEFLLSKQLPDGGWGESYLSSSNKEYTNLEENRSNLVHTSWALISLMRAGQAEIDVTPIKRGIRLLIDSQMEEGDFPQQEITGVFMKNCTLNYSSYRNIFPIWALGEYRRIV
ncbi:Prenyltransferase/squalene oxidase [Cynara cardunculus var. scolymus]|uniref:Prenyltransferase/squalene oxidase n=1 Tax=Cynara cardunculus var. scolymus TaxID=59895 RepID=A0A103YMK4_CYNCS|nr:Prenyltransferase/squalene oxidase [Cynara cardunculus var. scolymus]